jgi:hypothetical protein
MRIQESRSGEIIGYNDIRLGIATNDVSAIKKNKEWPNSHALCLYLLSFHLRRLCDAAWYFANRTRLFLLLGIVWETKN